MAVTAILPLQAALSGFDSSATWSQVEVGADAVTQPVTTFGHVTAAGVWEQSAVGLRRIVLTASGFNDYATGAADEWLRGNLGGSVVATAAPLGGTVGNFADITRGLLIAYRPIKAQVGDVPAVALAIQPTGAPMAEGQVTQASSAAITVSSTTTPVQIGSLTAAQNVYAAIHVLAVSGTTPTITAQIQSAATSGGAYTNRGAAGAVLTSTTGQWLSTGLAAVVTDTWWRLNLTVAGTTPSFTVLASLAVA
jgi:hypothetical protein